MRIVKYFCLDCYVKFLRSITISRGDFFRVLRSWEIFREDLYSTLVVIGARGEERGQVLRGQLQPHTCFLYFDALSTSGWFYLRSWSVAIISHKTNGFKYIWIFVIADSVLADSTGHKLFTFFFYRYSLFLLEVFTRAYSCMRRGHFCFLSLGRTQDPEVEDVWYDVFCSFCLWSRMSRCVHYHDFAADLSGTECPNIRLLLWTTAVILKKLRKTSDVDVT